MENPSPDFLGVLIDGAHAQLDAWADIEPPKILYHYTTPDGLLGILGSGAIYMSDAYCLNDRSEVTFGHQLVVRALVRRLNTDVSPGVKVILDMVKDYFEVDGDAQKLMRFYIVSFCENGNLLSQWREYGASGFSIGFSADGLYQAAQRLDPEKRVPLRRVEYNPERQIRAMEYVLDHFCEHVDTQFRAHKPDVWDDIVVAFTSDLLLCMATLVARMKDPVFHEEREWRLIYGVVGTKVLKRVKFRRSGSTLVPYLLLNLCGKRRRRNGLPIVEVTHAPVPEPQMQKRSLGELLLSFGYSERKVSISGSSIPLRTL